jgi:hypothetical protein
MTPLPDRFIEDRALRDAARSLLADDLARLRENLGEQGIASRVSSSVSSTITGRLRAGARDVLAQAQAQAGDHKGVLALLVGAIILFFARGPILDWLDDSAEADDVDDGVPASDSELTPVSEGDLA